MSDWEYAEAFKAMKEEGRRKRALNLSSSLRLLAAAGVEFKLLSSTHARVGEYDFWPSTGLFIHTKTKKRNRGVQKLIRLSKAAPPLPPEAISGMGEKE